MKLTKEQIEKFRNGLRSECEDDTKPYFDILCDLAIKGLEAEARGWQPVQCIHELAPNHTSAIGAFRCLLCGEVGDFVSQRYSQNATGG